MSEFLVNLVLILAALTLLLVWAVSASRRRSRERRQHFEDRRAILAALAGVAAPAAHPPSDDHDSTIGGSAPQAAVAEQLDAAAVTALLDLLEDRRPASRGAVASLISCPRSVWSASTRAGQGLGRRSKLEQDSDAPATPAEGTNPEPADLSQRS
jgi:hypothetical protein